MHNPTLKNNQQLPAIPHGRRGTSSAHVSGLAELVDHLRHHGKTRKYCKIEPDIPPRSRGATSAEDIVAPELVDFPRHAAETGKDIGKDKGANTHSLGQDRAGTTPKRFSGEAGVIPPQYPDETPKTVACNMKTKNENAYPWKHNMQNRGQTGTERKVSGEEGVIPPQDPDNRSITSKGLTEPGDYLHHHWKNSYDSRKEPVTRHAARVPPMRKYLFAPELVDLLRHAVETGEDIGTDKGANAHSPRRGRSKIDAKQVSGDASESPPQYLDSPEKSVL